MTERLPLSFDRATGRLEGASAIERCAALAFQLGARASAVFENRGFALGCKAVTPFIDQREIVTLLNDDARFAFPFGDGYWTLLLDRDYVYEVEIERFLRAVADADYSFIDGGANFGFWSVLASSRPYGSHPSIAIEAASSNAARLTRNAELNSGRFKVLHRAVSGTTGGQAWINGSAKHEAFAVSATGNGGSGESVELMALDGLLDQGLIAPGQRLVIKLDVEGLEIEAINGSKRLLESEVVLIVEEHGADRHHTVSRHLIDEARCRVFVFDPATERYEPVTDFAILDRVKTKEWAGYNVFATNSPFWEQKIASIPPSVRH